MTKNLLIFISHNFCVNCCGDAKKLDCDSQNKTCSRLANFLGACNLYKEPLDEKELNKLAHNTVHCMSPHIRLGQNIPDYDNKVDIYKAGYRKAMKDKQ